MIRAPLVNDILALFENGFNLVKKVRRLRFSVTEKLGGRYTSQDLTPCSCVRAGNGRK